jgi:hypothetical protein
MKIKLSKTTLVIFTGLVVFSFAFFTIADELSSSDKNIFLDSDQDGLSDSEEKTYGTDPQNRDTDGDGYTDGAEVKSGYDPLKHAPGDKLITNDQPARNASPARSDAASSGEPGDAGGQLTTDKEQVASEGNDTNEDKNLTQEVSAKIAGLVSSSSEQGKEISLEDLDALVGQVTESTLTFEDLPEIDEKDIKIKKQNYSKLSKEKREEQEKKDAQEYLVSASYILISNSPQKISSMKDIENFGQQIISQTELFASNLSDVSYFEDLTERGGKTLEQFKELEVPENVLDVHKKGLKLANYAISLEDTARPDPADPVGTMAKLSKVQSAITLSEEFGKEIFAEFAGLEVSGLPIDL